MPGAPGRAALEQLRPGERQHVDRRVARPLEQVLDEVEQRLIRPLHVLEDEHRRVDVGQPLEEQPPGREQVLALVAALLQREQVREARLDEAALLRVGKVLLDDRGELGERRGRLLVLGDPGAHPDHVGERPVRDALAVREAAPAVPVRDLRDPVEVLVELPRQPRLADPGDARDRDEMRLALVGADVEEILDLPELPVAADERRLETGRLERSARARDDAQTPGGAGRDRSSPSARDCRRRHTRRCRSVARFVDSPTRTVPGSAADCTREAVLTRSPATIPSPVAPSVTVASPVMTPARARNSGIPTSSPSAETAVTRSRAARTARSASSSVATGVPQTAITASPMNFSTVPPYRSISRRQTSK